MFHPNYLRSSTVQSLYKIFAQRRTWFRVFISVQCAAHYDQYLRSSTKPIYKIFAQRRTWFRAFISVQCAAHYDQMLIKDFIVIPSSEKLERP
jgi:hypothetical protein